MTPREARAVPIPGLVGWGLLALVLIVFIQVAAWPEQALRDGWWRAIAWVLPPPAPLEELFAVRPPVMIWIEGCALAAIGLIVVRTVPRPDPMHGLRLVTLTALALAATSAFGFVNGLLLDAATPLLGAGVVLLGVTIATLVQRSRARIRTRFQLLSERADRAALQAELNAAARLQASVLPPLKWSGPGVELACHHRPAEIVGGDFYDYAMVDEDHLFFLVADVSGKGLDASQFMLIAKTLWKSVALAEGPPLRAIAVRANAEILRENAATMFVTVLAGLLDVRSGEVEYVGAGHDMPWILRRGGELEQLAECAGPPVGLDAGADYPAGRTELAPGDRLILFTDGLTDAAATSGGLLGPDGLRKAIGAAPVGAGVEAVVADIVARIDRFTAGASQSDDQTMMVIGRN